MVTTARYTLVKTPGNDELAKEFYEVFWEGLKKPFLNDIDQAKLTKN